MSTVKVDIFVDEQYNINYICIGSLIVPIDIKDRLIDNLLNERCPDNKEWVWEYTECPHSSECKEDWHRLNGYHLHHRDFSKNISEYKKNIAKKWLKFLIENNKYDRGLVYFSLFYIDLTKLDRSFFGDEKNIQNIYNKFFRISLKGNLKWFFSDYNTIYVEKVIHDQGSMSEHKYFTNFNLEKLENETDGRIKILNKSINYLKSDHHKHTDKEDMRNAQLLQFIDLIIATTSQNIFNLSGDPFKKELAMIIRPLVERLLNSPYNKKSSYNYFRKQQITFFPKHNIDSAIERYKDMEGNLREKYKDDIFHTDVEMKMPEYDPQKTTLDDFLKMEENT